MSQSDPRPARRRKRTRRRLVVERLDNRRVLAAIVGTVFEDVNFSFSRDTDEPGAASRLVFIDSNNNSSLDVGEPIALADQNGQFRFDNLPDGTFSLRLFNGTSSQRQTLPIGTDGLQNVVTISDGNQFVAGSNGTSALTVDSIISTDLEAGTATETFVADSLTDAQLLPDGSLLVIGTDSSGETAFLVDGDDGSVAPVDLSGEDVPDEPLPVFSDLAIDGNGRGVAVENNPGLSPLRLIDASQPADGINVTVTDQFVPADTTVVTSGTGVRSVLASPNADGLSLSLFSNTMGSFIDTPISVDGLAELLAFDDASGLLAARTRDGDIGVLDANNQFNSLQTIDGPVGPVAIDGARDLLFAINPITTILSLFDLSNGELIVDLAVDFASIGTPVALATGSSEDELVVLGSTGIAEIALDRPRAVEVTVADQQDVDAVLFGVSVTSENTPPRYDTVPAFETNEDTPLNLAAPATLSGSIDDEGDTVVVVQTGDAINAVAIAQVDGALTFVPDENFHGVDSLTVVLADGQGISDSNTIEIKVNSVPDSPEGIILTIDPIPEDLMIGDPIGGIEVVDGDGGGHLIEIDDPRFGVVGGILVLNNGGLDFETEPLIPLTLTATDEETGEVIETSTILTIRDANDPVTAILPSETFVFENVPGGSIDEIRAVDQDLEQFHTFTVDDDRFIVDQFELRLVDGVALDFETEPTVVINVTAIESDTGNTFTQPITIEVRDFPEQPQGITLSNQTVTELTPGAVVGEVLVDGGSPGPQFEVTVNDPLFVVEGTTLRLADDQFVVREQTSQIQLEIAVVDLSDQFADVSETFVIEVLENPSPAHNSQNPFDVNHEGDASPLDALLIINYLNRFGTTPVGVGDLNFCYDVNGDGLISPLDALLVVNQLQSMQNATPIAGESEPEGEAPVSQPEQEPLTGNGGAPVNESPNLSDDSVLSGPAPSDASNDLSSTPGPSSAVPTTAASTTGNLDRSLSQLDDSDLEPEATDLASLEIEETIRLLSDENT